LTVKTASIPAALIAPLTKRRSSAAGTPPVETVFLQGASNHRGEEAAGRDQCAVADQLAVGHALLTSPCGIKLVNA
jgi:hypothetical protein